MGTIHITPARTLPTIYPNLDGESQAVQDAVKRAYDDIYQLRGNIAAVSQAHNQLKTAVDQATSLGTQNQAQINLVTALVAGPTSAMASGVYGAVILPTDLPVTGGTDTPVMSLVMTMPAGGTWRVLIGYGILYTVAAQTKVGSWLDDGMGNIFASDSAGINAANLLNNGLRSRDVSPLAYTGGTVVTFTLHFESTINNTVEALHNFGGQNSWMNALAIASS